MRQVHDKLQAKASGARTRSLAESIALPIGLTAAMAWSYWPTMRTMVGIWSRNPDYSHGYLVPFFSLAILWLRRQKFADLTPKPSRWGIALVAGALALRFAGLYYFVDWFDAVSLIPCLAGIALAAGGWGWLRWATPSLLFLIFMIPLPHGLEGSLSLTLRRWATEWSAFALQTLGLPVRTEGNVLLGPTTSVGVAEACSGLGMLVSFLAVSTALVILLERHWLDKTILLLSAAPIALMSNTIRIAATLLAQEKLNGAIAHAIFHDWAGWLMMLLALGLMGLELRILSWLFVDEELDSVVLPLNAWPPPRVKADGIETSPTDRREDGA